MRSAAFESLHVSSIEIIDSLGRIFLPDRAKQGTSTNVVFKTTILRFGYFWLGNQSILDRLIGETNLTKVVLNKIQEYS